MCARTDGQVHIGRRDVELLEEHIRHIDVIVLAGVDEGLGHICVVFQGVQDGDDLHEVGARSDDVKYVHGFSNDQAINVAGSVTSAAEAADKKLHLPQR
jgi:hypothetical protein